VRGGKVVVLEGDWRPKRVAMLKFPTTEAVHAFSETIPSTPGLKALRHRISSTQMVMVRGRLESKLVTRVLHAFDDASANHAPLLPSTAFDPRPLRSIDRTSCVARPPAETRGEKTIESNSAPAKAVNWRWMSPIKARGAATTDKSNALEGNRRRDL